MTPQHARTQAIGVLAEAVARAVDARVAEHDRALTLLGGAGITTATLGECRRELAALLAKHTP